MLPKFHRLLPILVGSLFLLGAGSASAASSVDAGPAARPAAVDPGSGEEYDPEALAQQCVDDVLSGYLGGFFYNFGVRLRIRGKAVLRAESYTMPMRSGFVDLPCPPPAGRSIKVRIKVQDNRLRYQPASHWVQVVEDSEAAYTDRTVTFPIFRKRVYTCLPRDVKASLRRRNIYPVRHAAIEIDVTAHSLNRSGHRTKLTDLYNADTC